jgi:Glycosyl hydrolase family 26
MRRSKRLRRATLRVPLRRALSRVVLCGAVILVPSKLIAAPATSSSVPLGFYVGAGKLAFAHDAARDTGTHPILAEDFLSADSGWAGMTDESQMGWLLQAWQGGPYQLVLSVPMIPTTPDGSPVATLADGARGSYDQYYRTLAQDLVAHGEDDAVLRLGWEFNGTWYAWAVRNSADAANYAEYFRQIVTTMRKVSPRFRFDWNVSDGIGAPYDFTTAYPGDAYVNFIGTDVYDETCATHPTPQRTWSTLLTATGGLDWAASFAAAHHKAVTVPEWGLDEGGTAVGCSGGYDQPYFVDQMANWLNVHSAAFSIYFDFDAPDGSHRIEDSTFTRSLVAFHHDFGLTLLQSVAYPLQSPVSPGA